MNKVDECSNSLNLIENYETSYEKSKMPYKKGNYKYLTYKRRLNYGKLQKC